MQRNWTGLAKLASFGSALILGFAIPFSAISGGATSSRAIADENQPIFTDTPSTPSLKDTLDAGLKARLPEEFTFVERVVKMVDHGELPLEMVQSTFLWARKKRVHQMQYFEHALRLRADEIGVRL